MKQRTVAKTFSFEGIGLHSGKPVHVEIRPAKANTGLCFRRSDIQGAPMVKASPKNVLDTILATRLGPQESPLSTIEHLMAAFFAFGIDNAIVEVDNFEIPILDGSALPFLILLEEAGIQELEAHKDWLVVHKTIEVSDPKHPDRFIRIEPSKKPQLSYAIDFPQTSVIGKQLIHLSYTGNDFCQELSFARTFCLAEDIAFMKNKGLALGGSLENALVVSTSLGVVNEKGMRSKDECVRHKALDCMGDLALLGKPILGHIIASKAGHDLHTKLALAVELALETSKQVEVKSSLERSFLTFPDFPKTLATFKDLSSLAFVRG